MADANNSAPDAITQAEKIADVVAAALAKYAVAYSHVTLADLSTAARTWSVHETGHGNPFVHDVWLGRFDNKAEADALASKLCREEAVEAVHRLAAHGAGEGLREALAKDRADWLLDAVACATQDRRFLRGDTEYDAIAGEAILLNGEKAIKVAIARALPIPPTGAGSTTPSNGEGVTDRNVIAHAIGRSTGTYVLGRSPEWAYDAADAVIAALATTSSPDASPDSGAQEHLRALTDLIEGPFGWAVCRNDKGERLKDNPIYVRAYLAAREEK